MRIAFVVFNLVILIALILLWVGKTASAVNLAAGLAVSVGNLLEKSPAKRAKGKR